MLLSPFHYFNQTLSPQHGLWESTWNKETQQRPEHPSDLGWEEGCGWPPEAMEDTISTLDQGWVRFPHLFSHHPALSLQIVY